MFDVVLKRWSRASDQGFLVATPLVAVFCLILVSVWLTLHIHDLGFRFGHLQPDMPLDYAMGALWWMVFTIVILLVAQESRQMLLLAWIAKLFITLVAMLFYEHHYGLDAYEYFGIRKTGYSGFLVGFYVPDHLLPQLFGSTMDEAGRTRTLENAMRLIYLVTLPVGPYYHAMKVTLAFLGLLGVWWFYRAVVAALGRPYPPAFYLLALFPSILFWSSILGKDPLQFFIMGIYAYGGVMWLMYGRMTALWFIGVGLLGMYLMRPWMTIIAGASVALATLLGRCRKWQVISVLLLLLPAVALSGLLAPAMIFGEAQAVADLALTDMALEIVRMKMEGIATDTRSSGGSGDDLSGLKSRDAVLENFPTAMFSGLFRPLPFDVRNPMIAMAAAENTVVLALSVVALFRFKRGYLRDPLVLWTMLFVLLWTAIHGFIVMANFGSGARYKLQVWPFLLMVILMLTHRQGRALLDSRLPGRESAATSQPSLSPGSQ